MRDTPATDARLQDTPPRMGLRISAWLERVQLAARWDMRWRVVAFEARNDLSAIGEAIASLAIGAVMLPVAVATLVLRVPLKPLQWLWLAWRCPDDFERVKEVMTKRSNIIKSHSPPS